MRLASVGVVLVFLLAADGAPAADYTQGALYRKGDQGRPAAECPLKHTAVTAEISGTEARVNVAQEFRNPFETSIEAVYVFPLPHNAAVDRMTMTVGSRTILGKIKRREEARALYEAARDAGKVAGLLDQERPNIFTQSVANILPGDEVKVTISYVQTLKYEEGRFEFVFPMVVGPRYAPAGLADTARITPPVTPEGTRAGHDISIEVALDAGLAVANLESRSHEVAVQWRSRSRAVVRLRDQKVIPNKDFILHYRTAGRGIADAVLTHRADRGGFFSLILQPPELVTAEDASPKELVFVLDTSGSMSGFPIEKAKEAMKLALDGLYPQDTFNLITFSGDTQILFPEPVPATAANLRVAQLFLQSRAGSGGTEMMKAIQAALAPSGAGDHLRIVCFMTDGLVGNDMQIIAEVQKHPEARVFAFGIGQAPNRFLLDNLALHGNGEVEYVGLKDDGSAAARRFHQRVRNPLLTSLSIDWGGLPVIDVYPRRIPDLFGAKPVVVTGRYYIPARGVVRLRGRAGGREIVREIRVDLPAAEDRHEVLATLWARECIEDLMSQDYAGIQARAARPEVQEHITQLGLDFGLMTQFTSLVAVEEMVVTTGGRPTRVEVPVEMPEGVSYEGVFGRGGRQQSTGFGPGYASGSGGGFGGGVYRSGGGGSVGGVVGGFSGGASHGITMSAITATAPPPPPQLRAAPKSLAAPTAPINQKLDEALAAMLAAADKTVKVSVQILLRDASPAVIEQLRQLGFEVVRPAGRDMQVIGRIAIEKLGELTRIDAVRYVVLWTGEK